MNCHSYSYGMTKEKKKKKKNLLGEQTRDHGVTTAKTNQPLNGVGKKRCLEEYSHDEDEIWKMAYAMSEDATIEELREIKNNLLSLTEPEYVQTFDVFGNIEDDPKEFHEHY
ncbi:hypothetical protein G9A89_007807 [Geosiphon pyriformis]|nr:hypothetical protein G9A89_007807 [Geosiphon pyriformis]